MTIDTVGMRVLSGIAALGAVAAGLTATASPVAAAASHHPARLGAPAVRGHAVPADALADPTSNTSPSNAFLDACYSMGTSKADNDRCDTAALKDFDGVRASEGLGPMTLPGDFDTLKVPAQLLAISNIERTDRGLPPVEGLSTSLDSYAQQGANADEDPPFPDPLPGNAGSANWAGAGNSALLDDFFWMYDDGLGSGNLDCTPSDQSGCWGHRHDILFDFDTPLLMGAAVAYNTTYGTSMTEEFIGDDTSEAADVAPTWATIAATFPLGLSTTSVHVLADTARNGSEPLTLTAPAANMSAQASVIAGSGSWSVTPRSCSLPHDGSQCTLTLHFTPPGIGSHNGTLRIVGPNGDQSVGLVGYQWPPRLAIATSTSKLHRGHAATVAGVVTAHTSGKALAHQRVELDRRVGRGTWNVVGHRSTRSSGRAAFDLHPAKTASYRLRVLSSTRSVEVTSATKRIRVVQ